MTVAATANWLRHTVATLAYRAAKVLRDAPPAFAQFSAGPDSRSALALVAHLGDLMEWAERRARGETRWHAVPQASWSSAIDRFFGALRALDTALAERAPDDGTCQLIFQGPVADALSHVGQLALMRRLAGAPIRPESYARAAIAIGHVGLDQPAARAELDGDASQPKGKG